MGNDSDTVKYPHVTKVEVISRLAGNVISAIAAENVRISLQDEGKTLKLFYNERTRSLSDMSREELDNHINTFVIGPGGEVLFQGVHEEDDNFGLIISREHPESTCAFLSSLFVRFDDKEDDRDVPAQESETDTTTDKSESEEDPRIAHFRTLHHEARLEAQLALIRGNTDARIVWEKVRNEIEDILDGVKDR